MRVSEGMSLATSMLTTTRDLASQLPSVAGDAAKISGTSNAIVVTVAKAGVVLGLVQSAVDAKRDAFTDDEAKSISDAAKDAQEAQYASLRTRPSAGTKDSDQQRLDRGGSMGAGGGSSGRNDGGAGTSGSGGSVR